MARDLRKGWSLEARDWHELERVLPEAVWRRVRFRDLDQDSVPSGPGVYAVCSSPAVRSPAKLAALFPALNTVLYVGQASNLRQRFLQHLAGTKPEMAAISLCYVASVFWFTELSPERLNDVEREMINCFGPTANLRRGLSARPGPMEPA